MIKQQHYTIKKDGNSRICLYHSTDAASTDGGLELIVKLLDGTGGIKSLGEQNDAVQEEEGGDAVYDVLHELDSGEEKSSQLLMLVHI